MNRRHIKISSTRLIGAFVVALFFSACSGTSTEEAENDEGTTSIANDAVGEAISPEPTGDEVVELTAWFITDEFTPDFTRFHEENPGIRVNTEVVILEEVVQEYERAWGTDFAPDLFQSFHQNIGVLAERDRLLDLSEAFQTWEEEDPDLYGHLLPEAFSGASWDGTPYGLTIYTFPQWLAYRIDWYEEAGLEHPPRTWDDVLEASAIFAADGKVGFSTIGSREHDPSTWFTAPAYYMGMTDENGVPQLTSPGGVYFIEFFQELAASGLTSDDVLTWGSGEMREAFYAGDAAHILASKAQNTNHQEEVGEYGELWGSVQPPLQRAADAPADGRHVTLTGPYYVNAETDHPNEASLVLRYLAEAETLMDRRFTSGTETLNTEVESNGELIAEHPWLADLATWDPMVETMPAHRNQLAISEVLKDLLQDVLQNPDRDAQEVAEEFQAQIDEAAS